MCCRTSAAMSRVILAEPECYQDAGSGAEPFVINTELKKKILYKNSLILLIQQFLSL
jgi:hypothetical protein